MHHNEYEGIKWKKVIKVAVMHRELLKQVAAKTKQPKTELIAIQLQNVIDEALQHALQYSVPKRPARSSDVRV